MSTIIGRQDIKLKKYHIVCFNCGSEVVYKENEIHRNPGLNLVVRKHGFSGYEGEIHCPGCGTWLPHYEQNLYRGSADEDAAMVCPECGKPVSRDGNFCKYCGNRISRE